ncbi:Fc.00g040240.m01.CDS01 [Cosmosporella sp. VM-42]
MFMDKYVIYPCNSSSSPGFLEHLPGLFKEVNIEGRYALRWAVQAASFADLSKEQGSNDLTAKALEHYGNALSALGKSLAEKGKTPDDYDLMTVVILDIFETLFDPEASSVGSHAQGMAHILRLRGHDQFYDPRGWGLFRLAHHRLQKQQLAKCLDPLPESREWLANLNEEVSFVHLEKDSLEISTICQRARRVLNCLNTKGLPFEQLVELIDEMLRLDEKAAEWRQRPEWAYRTLHARDIEGDQEVISQFPETVELHPDVWMAYEWNYHRTGRVILHQQLLACIRKALLMPSSQRPPDLETKLLAWEASSLSAIHNLVTGVLSSVPQTFGDIDNLGRCPSTRSNPPRCQAIGGYLLLWPMKVIKDPRGMSTLTQKEAAGAIFERIRDCTGMKSSLGELSII